MEATGFDGLTDDYKFHNLYADWAGIPPRNYPLILPLPVFSAVILAFQLVC